MKEKPGYYAIIIAPIRYAEDLTEFQKLLYAEITALADKNGYCFASNSYFAKLYKKTAKWISSVISDMCKKGYIEVIHNKEEGNVRKIFVGELMKLKKQIQVPIPLEQEAIPEKEDTPIPFEQDTLSQKNGNIIIQDNTTSVNREDGEKNSPPPPTPTQVDFDKPAYVASMRDVEIRGKQWVEYRNISTGRNDIPTPDIKKVLIEVVKKPLEYFKERVSKFVVIRDLIVAKQAERLFFHKIRLRDLGMFSKNINRFTAEDKAIIEDLAIGSEKQKAIRLLNSSPSQEEKKAEPVVEKSPLTEEQKKEKKEMFKRIQEKIIQKTTI